jgi:hypothetical protein
MLFKNPVRTSKRTPHFTITKISWLMLLKEIITVCEISGSHGGGYEDYSFFGYTAL